MSTFENKNSVRTIETEIVQKLKNNEARPKFTGSYSKKKTCSSVSTSSLRLYYPYLLYSLLKLIAIKQHAIETRGQSTLFHCACTNTMNHIW